MLIRSAMADIEKYTCIEFTPRKSQVDYIHIISDDGCSSQLGKMGGRQEVSLDSNGCMSRRTVIHELVHALGFDHMQSRSDRDKFVEIVWKNVIKKEAHNFEKVSPKKFSNFGTPYDYFSIMHYDPTSFSVNDKRTIIPKDSNYRNIIGQISRLSNGDVLRINKMYDCKED